MVLFFYSILTGLALAAPFGVAGAMVADAALAHNRNRLDLTVIAAVAADTIVALLTSLFSDVVGALATKYKIVGLRLAGIAFILLGISIAFSAIKSHKGVINTDSLNVAYKWIFGHMAPAFGTFLVVLFHPLNIIAFLAVVHGFSQTFDNFSSLRWLFVTGISVGSMTSFVSVAILFWIIRKNANNFVYYFRYAIALIITIGGLYFSFKEF